MAVFQRNDLRASGKIARERTKLTIASDRLSCNPEEMKQLQKEVISVLSKYIDMDKSFLKIRMDIVYETERGVQDVKTIQIK